MRQLKEKIKYQSNEIVILKRKIDELTNLRRTHRSGQRSSERRLSSRRPPEGRSSDRMHSDQRSSARRHSDRRPSARRPPIERSTEQKPSFIIYNYVSHELCTYLFIYLFILVFFSEIIEDNLCL